MANIKTIKSDTQKEHEGVWETYPGTDLQLLIARLRTPAFERATRQLIKPTARRGTSATATERESMDKLAPAVAQYVLLGWKNLDDENGQPIAYSYEKALELLRTPELHDLYSFVLEIAGDAETYRQDYLQDSAKNSGSASTGS